MVVPATSLDMVYEIDTMVYSNGKIVPAMDTFIGGTMRQLNGDCDRFFVGENDLKNDSLFFESDTDGGSHLDVDRSWLAAPKVISD